VIPATFVDCNDWGIPECLMLADEDFNNSTDILLGADAFFEVLSHDQKTQPRNYPVLQDTELGWLFKARYLYQRLKEFQGKVSSFAIKTT